MGGGGGGDPSVPGSERPNRLVGAVFTLPSAPPATSASPPLHAVFFPLFPSPFLPLFSVSHSYSSPPSV